MEWLRRTSQLLLCGRMAENASKTKRGCLFTLLAAVGIGLLLLLLMAGAAGYYTYRNLAAHASDQPTPAPEFVVDEVRYRDLQRRIQAFETQIQIQHQIQAQQGQVPPRGRPGALSSDQSRSGSAGARLELSEEDLNMLARRQPGLFNPAQNLHFEMRDGALRVQGSVRVDVPGPLEGRFLNGRFTIRPNGAGSKLPASIESYETADGAPAPTALMLALRNPRVVLQAIDAAGARQQVESVRRFEILNHRLIIEVDP
jgi:hypothetical protein